MWRLGVSENRGPVSKDKKKDLLRRKPNFSSLNSDKLVGKNANPVSLEGVLTTRDRETRGSFVATEHLLMKRGSRSSSTFTEADFALKAHDSSDRLKTPETMKARKNSSSTLTTVKQIQDRVKKVVNEYEIGPYEDYPVEESHLLLEIQLNLASISDDMLRINVGTLLDKYRKVSKKVRDEVQYWEQESNNKQELLQSVQTWMEEDRMDDLDDYEDLLPMPDTTLIENCLDSIQDNVKKIATLQSKISRMKVVGSDTTFLERQKLNLQRQVKQDVLENEYQWKKGSGHHKKAEFNYLKNAANEIYNLVQRTRMEGMAHSHQFEEQLKELLEVMEEKEEHIEFLQQRIEQQKKLVHRWCADYDKLQSDYIIAKDEVLLEKRNKLTLAQEIEMMKHRIDNQEEYHKIYMKRSDHDETVKDFENHIQALKQKMEVLGWTVREKDTTIEEHQRHIQRLKSVLRKGSLNSNSSEVLTRSSGGSLNGGRHQPFVTNERSLTGLEVINPPPSPSRSWVKEEDSLRKRIDVLENENMQLRMKANQVTASSTKLPQLSGKPVGIQTDPYQPPQILKSNTDVAAATMEMATQTLPNNYGALRTMTPLERTQSFHVVEQMSKQYGTAWKDAAVALTKLRPEDINQIENALNTEQDMIRMYCGSPTEASEELRERIPELMTDAPQNLEEEEELSEMKESMRPITVDIAPVQVSDSVQDLAEKMLSGNDPKTIRETNTAGISDMLQEAETMTGRISNFVDKVQGYIGCQTGMMNEAIDKMKQMLPPAILAKLEKKRISLKELEAEMSCVEHTDEWQNMSISEQIRHKLKFVEDAMKEMVKESMNVFIGEIAKQHAEYNEMHNTVKESSDVDVSTLVSNPKLAVRDIQNKVEASVRYITRVSQAERRSVESANMKNVGSDGGAFLANTFMDIHGRQAGATKAYDDRRYATQNRIYPMQQQVKEKIGAAALQSLVDELTPKKASENQPLGKKTESNTKRPALLFKATEAQQMEAILRQANSHGDDWDDRLSCKRRVSSLQQATSNQRFRKTRGTEYTSKSLSSTRTSQTGFGQQRTKTIKRTKS